jgi:hypothetical protein
MSQYTVHDEMIWSTEEAFCISPEWHSFELPNFHYPRLLYPMCILHRLLTSSYFLEIGVEKPEEVTSKMYAYMEDNVTLDLNKNLGAGLDSSGLFLTHKWNFWLPERPLTSEDLILTVLVRYWAKTNFYGPSLRQRLRKTLHKVP